MFYSSEKLFRKGNHIYCFAVATLYQGRAILYVMSDYLGLSSASHAGAPKPVRLSVRASQPYQFAYYFSAVMKAITQGVWWAFCRPLKNCLEMW
jgi:hypothetical protein